MKKRIVIIGNSGSGKSYLAGQLSAIFGARLIHLDSIFWMPGGFNERRSADEISNLIAGHTNAPAWVVEGVFGELASRFLDSAESLLWLDMPLELCRTSLIQRGSESSKQRDPAQAQESFRALLQWSSEYWSRTNFQSHQGHLRLFDGFKGDKIRFERRADVDAYVHAIREESKSGGFFLT